MRRTILKDIPNGLTEDSSEILFKVYCYDGLYYLCDQTIMAILRTCYSAYQAGLERGSLEVKELLKVD